MKDKVKVLSIVFCIVIFMFLMTNTSNATEYTYGNDLKYEITDYYAGDYQENDGVNITWINRYVTSIEIPSYINGYKVVSIGNAACQDSTYLESITLPSTLEAIGNCAFQNCTALKTFSMPDNVFYIGQYILDGCTSLTSVKISNNLKVINTGFIENCTSITDVTVPYGVEVLDYWAFRGCTGLKNISLPKTLKTIESSCFYGCTSLETFNMPDSVTDLGGTGIQSTFSNCTSLKSIKLSKNLTYIPSQMFQGCTSLEEVIVPDKVTRLGNHIFSDSGLKRLSVPQQVNYLGWGFINDAHSVTEFIFPAEYREVDVNQFGGFEGMTLVFPRTIQTFDIAHDGLTNSTVWGFSETGVKDWALEGGMTFNELPLLSYSTHVQNIGDQAYVTNGVMAGTSGRGLRLENISINIDTSKTVYSGGIKYSTHVKKMGWTDWSTNGTRSGSSGKGLRLEAIKIELTGSLANYFDIYYRVHAQNVGWLGWAKNGEESGTAGYGYRLEGIEILILPKTLKYAPGSTAYPFKEKVVVKTANLSSANVTLTSKGETKQLTADFKVNGVTVTDITWKSSNTNVVTVDSTGKLTAVGSGTATVTALSSSKGMSATCSVKVSIIEGDYKKGDLNDDGLVDSADVATAYTLIKYNNATDREMLIADMNCDGVLDQSDVDMMANFYKYGSPSVYYTTHVEKVGWQNYVSDGEMAGTSGKGLRLEAIKIRLTGDMEKSYDIYYRVHAQNKGWLGWAKNGEAAGTAGYGYRLEGIEIMLVEKGNSAPGKITGYFYSK